jgi:hypothetical protein
MKRYAIPTVLSLAMLLLAAASAMASLPVMWEKDYGGPYYDVISWIENTSDGGLIAVGSRTITDTSSRDLWLVKINAHGDTVWSRQYGSADTETGAAVLEAPDGGYVAFGTITYDGTSQTDVFLLRTDEDGDSLWARTHGFAGWDYAYGAAHAYEGGYVITGVADVYGTGTGDVFVSKVDADGYWENTVVFGGSDTDWAQRIRQTSDGGYIVVGGTRSYGYGSEDVYLVKLNAARTIQWQQFYGGTGWDSGYDVRETSDGGFIVAGATPHGFGSDDAFLVRTDAYGDSIWTRNYGGTGYDNAESIVITCDGYFVFAGRTDSYETGSMDVYVQRVAPNGDPSWYMVRGGSGYDVGSSIQLTPDDGLVVAGRYASTTLETQGYVMRTLGYSPRIWAASDIDGDQGGQLRVCWFRSAYDDFESIYPIYEYSVWRRIDSLPLTRLTPPAVPAIPKVLAGTEFPAGDWDYVTSVPALCVNEYCCVVPTLCDWSAANGDCWSVFFVAAETSVPVTYFASPPDSGMSFDNLEPSPPAGLHMQTENELAWEAAPEDDFDHFIVYGSSTGDFDDAEFISDTYIPALDVSAASHDYYHVTTVDHAGNQSDDAVINNAYAVATGDPEPLEFGLRQNTPNPFSSSTLIAFDLPVQGRVTVEVIDVSGRVVCTLLDDVMPAGGHSVTWNATGAENRGVGSGVYFIRMTAGDFKATRKILRLE